MTDRTGQPGQPALPERLRAALMTAMRAGDSSLVAALRVALAALANAEAVPAAADRAAGVAGTLGDDRFAGSVPGLAASEVPRRLLSAREQAAILADEVSGLHTAAQRAADVGDPAKSADLIRVADLLAELADESH